MTVQLLVDFNLKDKLHGILCSNDLEHYLKDCISCYTVCVIVICLLYQIMNNTAILKFAVCQISVISPMIKKSDKSPPMMNGDEGGQLSDFIGGGHRSYEGDIRLIGGIPPVPPLGKTLILPPEKNSLFSILFHSAEERLLCCSTKYILHIKQYTDKVTVDAVLTQRGHFKCCVE